MDIIGIDFSINYPSVCISHDFKEFKFLSVINDKKVSNKRTVWVDEQLDDYLDITLKTTNSTRNDQSIYHLQERDKLVNAIELINKLILETKKHIKSKEVIVAIEGLAYGAKGKALLDIAQGTGIVRKVILELLLNNKISNFFVFTPSEMKQSIGLKGNADKILLFNKFLDDPVLDTVKDSDLYKFLLKNRNHDYIFNGKKVGSPWNDMIDAYLAILTIYNNI